MLRGLFYAFISIQIVSMGSAEISGKYCIQTIEDVLQYLPDTNKEKTLVAFNWDLTVSANLDEENPLREAKKTSDTFNEIGKNGAKIIILTSRLDGASKNYPRDDYTRPEIEKTLNDMLHAMNDQGLGLEKYGGLADNGYWEFPIPQANSNVMTQDNIVFAGAPRGSAKGYVAQALIEKNRLKEQPDVILYVERDSQHLQLFEEVFEHRPEKVILIHYPHRKACEKGFTSGKELKSVSPTS